MHGTFYAQKSFVSLTLHDNRPNINRQKLSQVAMAKRCLDVKPLKAMPGLRINVGMSPET